MYVSRSVQTIDLLSIIYFTADVTLIAVIVVAVTFVGLLTICTTCEHYIASIQYLYHSTDSTPILIAHYDDVHRCLFVLLEATL